MGRAILYAYLWRSSYRRYSNSLSVRYRSSRRNYYKVEIERDVRYSDDHPRNVMDVYYPKEDDDSESCDLNPYRAKSVLFVHGGMWIRGDKSSNPVSMYDIVSHVTGIRGKNNEVSTISNVGKSFAQLGITTYVMNYRLSDSTIKEPLYSKQVVDVSRGIAFMMRKERKRCCSLRNIDSPQIYLMGHSAGAHLLALALASSSKWLADALHEQDSLAVDTLNYISGFIGVSGPYNLHRLKMDQMSPFTVEPAFGIGSHHLKIASPIHALQEKRDCPSLLANLPILLLNAEDDFHLTQDSKELLVALDRENQNTSQRRSHNIIHGTSHLSIIRDFGSDSIAMETQETDQSWTNNIIDYGRVISNFLTNNPSNTNTSLSYILDFIEIEHAAARNITEMKLKRDI